MRHFGIGGLFFASFGAGGLVGGEVGGGAGGCEVGGPFGSGLLAPQPVSMHAISAKIALRRVMKVPGIKLASGVT